MNRRRDPAFQLIRLRLEQQKLPVCDLDYLNNWENVEFSLLCLEDEQFKPIYEDALMRQKMKEDKKNPKRAETTTLLSESRLPSDIQNQVKEDRFISEMEKQFAEGNFDNIAELLKKYD